MNIQLTVKTADGVPVVGAQLVLGSGAPTSTDANGTAALSTTDNSFTVTATMQNYCTQATSVAIDSNGAFVWDDPGTIVTGSSSQLNMEIRLGRLAPAPTVAYQDSIFVMSNKAVDPVQHTFTVANGEYAFLYAGEKMYWSATSPNLLVNSPAAGWASFNAASQKIEPRTKGRFALLEWAPPGGDPAGLNRYLIGVWRPRTTVTPGSVPRDAIVFYTPNTVSSRGYLADTPPYRHNYPYALNQADGSKKLTQRYVHLGLRYIFNEKFFSYQMLAAKRDALLVVPIQPAGNWEDFQRVEGMQRLLAEVILYEHRQQVGDDSDTNAIDTAPTQSFTRTTAARHLPPPALGKVATAAFSAGMNAITQLMKPVKSQTAARSWTDESANPYSAAPNTFLTSWCEIWDFDGSYNAIGTPGTWAGKLANWQRADGHDATADRIVRCYHTDYTGWKVTDIDAVKAVIGKPSQTATGSILIAGKAAELEGERGTAVWLNRAYLTGNGPPDKWDESATDTHPPDTPDFWSGVDPAGDVGGKAHQAVPVICFAHAAGLSQLRKI